MASISANGSKGHHKFTLTVTETSTSVSNNTSTISYSFKLSPITKRYDWDWKTRTISYTIKINGASYTGTIPKYDGSSTVTLKSGTQTVSHNADGTKTIEFSFDVRDEIGETYTSGNASASGSMDLTPLAKPVSGAAPIINAYVEDINDKTFGLTGNIKKLIKYHSTAYATMDVSPQGGASINESLCIIRNGSKTNNASNPYAYTFNNVESNVFTFSAEDDRGYIGTATVTADMIDYVKPTCNIADGAPDADGDMYLYCSGNYFNGSFGKTSNTLTVQYSYYGSDGSSGSGNMAFSTSGNRYTASANVSNLNYQATYTFTITATDKLETVTSTKAAVKTKPLFHWGENDFTFEVPVNFNGNASTWTPYLTADGAVVNGKYDIQKGWYQKLGNVVTIGWQIKADIKSGYHSTPLIIEGIPFTPNTSAFGGGVAHNICTTAGFVFEGWCVDVYDRITARIQPCNNTTAGNLEIASDCYYPKVGDNPVKVTLAGTICYMV